MSDLVAFVKYEAAGNDFLIVEDPGDGPALSPDEARSLCERWFGVGADGVITVSRGTRFPFAMRLTNADGTDAAISGNGLRCLAAHLHERGRLESPSVDIETAAGVRHAELELAGGRVVGATVAKFFGEAPEQQLEADLGRFKTLIEAGQAEAVAAGGSNGTA